MKGESMTENRTFGRILEKANRADPYPLYAELRKTPVCRQEDGSYVVSTYREIVALLHDPRVSSDRRNLDERFQTAEQGGLPPAFIALDPPEHDRLRSLAMRHFGPPANPGLVDGLRPELTAIITELIDAITAATRADIVEAVAYPFPVTVICRLLGVPREDEPHFHALSAQIVETVGPGEGDIVERQRRREHAIAELGGYLAGLVDARRGEPREDLLSALLTGGGETMTPAEVVSTATLLLVAGHETTVNLITNGMLTLLRHPEEMRRLRHDPGLAAGTVEELLRYEPPVHFPATRAALDDITIGDVTIPRGSPIVLALAAGNRDPDHVSEPERFDPCRPDNQHLGFGGGIHYCFGAPLARLETQIALVELVRRLRNPRLVTDPPPYRPSTALRGPRRLLVDFDGIDTAR
jgi:cytochrome P450